MYSLEGFCLNFLSKLQYYSLKEGIKKKKGSNGV